MLDKTDYRRSKAGGKHKQTPNQSDKWMVIHFTIISTSLYAWKPCNPLKMEQKVNYFFSIYKFCEKQTSEVTPKSFVRIHKNAFSKSKVMDTKLVLKRTFDLAIFSWLWHCICNRVWGVKIVQLNNGSSFNDSFSCFCPSRRQVSVFLLSPFRIYAHHMLCGFWIFQSCSISASSQQKETQNRARKDKGVASAG